MQVPSTHLNLSTNPDKVYSTIEKEKSVFKIITKTKNENFFIEKWIIHHLNILQDTKLIIFDNMSDDAYVHSIYEKYKDDIILVSFDWYMDCLHFLSWSKQLYQSVAISSNFFTIIDSDEYLYIYDDNKLVNDNRIIKFLGDNTDCNFYCPCFLENITDNDKLFLFNPHNLELLHWSKPIINTKLIPIFEESLKKHKWTSIQHTHLLPILTYGKTQIKFVLLHLKNLNKYQRINANMLKLLSLNVVKNKRDFSTLLKLDIDSIDGELGRQYVVETRKLVENILHNDKNSADMSRDGIIEIYDDLRMKFTPESYEQDFKKFMNSDYFDLINFDPDKIDINRYTTIHSCL
jgi:hypothetical protein